MRLIGWRFRRNDGNGDDVGFGPEDLVWIVKCDSFPSKGDLVITGLSHLVAFANNDHLRAAKANHVRDVTEGACGKRVHYVQDGDVDDDSTRTELADLRDEGVTQLHQVFITQSRLNGGNQIGALLENGNFPG